MVSLVSFYIIFLCVGCGLRGERPFRESFSQNLRICCVFISRVWLEWSPLGYSVDSVGQHSLTLMSLRSSVIFEK